MSKELNTLPRDNFIEKSLDSRDMSKASKKARSTRNKTKIKNRLTEIEREVENIYSKL